MLSAAFTPKFAAHVLNGCRAIPFSFFCRDHKAHRPLVARCESVSFVPSFPKRRYSFQGVKGDKVTSALRAFMSQRRTFVRCHRHILAAVSAAASSCCLQYVLINLLYAKCSAANSRQARLTVEHTEHFTTEERDTSLGRAGKTNKPNIGVNNGLGVARWVCWI